MKKISLFLIILLLLPLIPAQAPNHEKYSFENAERLKPLINWRDYGPEAFKEAQKENKPIFLLLTAPSWCYWCQVYESEDYLFNPQVVYLINEKYIPIYVDADKRQDLTRQYLEGGWPSTTILTPSKERLFGFSGVRPIPFMIENLNSAFAHTKSQSNDLTFSYNYQATPLTYPTRFQLQQIKQNYAQGLLQLADQTNGGFGSGQKFPQGRALDYALDFFEETNDPRYLNLVKTTLENQYTNIDELETNYNLFDPVEGGFHRYGTKPDWSPPHFEKMLYDNARLLKAYAHLQLLMPKDPIVNEVVKKTDEYILSNYLDIDKGGFFSNTDVHGEDSYYAKNPRPEPKARVEETKYANWNAEAILTYLYLYEISSDPEYKTYATKALDFFQKEMISEKGALHFITPENKKGVQGNLLDNSYMLLAFTTASQNLNNPSYLNTAKQIADFSLSSLYDYNSGGFFERNSQDIDLYAPGENIILTKPSEENAIITYALLKLYSQTQQQEYLKAALATLGQQLPTTGSLDRGYYHIKSAEYILNNNLLNISLPENLGTKENFWLNELPIGQKLSSNSQFVVSDKGLEKIQGPIIILLIIATLAGLLSFLSPCTYPILPAYIAYSFKASKKNIKLISLTFFLGLALTFTILGMSATTLGIALKNNLTLFTQIAGTLLVATGVFMLLGKSLPVLKIKKQRPTSYLASFIFGAIMGISWTPCVGPILIAILILASTTSSVFTGGLMLFFYAIGLAIPLLLLAAYLGKLDKSSRIWKFIKGKNIVIELDKNKKLEIHSSTLISGLLFIILGFLVFSGTLTTINQYFSTTSFQGIINTVEDRLLNLV